VLLAVEPLMLAPILARTYGNGSPRRPNPKRCVARDPARRPSHRRQSWWDGSDALTLLEENEN